MKMTCSEGSDYGGKVSIFLDIPEQDAVDQGYVPEISIDCLDLLIEDQQKGLEGTACMFSASASDIFMEFAQTPESAETVALWLDHMAGLVRSKFKAD